jgi:hypothetical protein
MHKAFSFTRYLEMRVILYALACSAMIASTCNSQVVQPSYIRDWQFPVGQGVVKVELTSTPSTVDQQAVYSLKLICMNATPSVRDEAGYLETVIRDMEHAGLSPSRIANIFLELVEPDVSRRLAIAAYNSPDWAEANSSSYGKVTVRLLNSMGAYEPFDEVLKAYGLAIEVRHAEHISTIDSDDIGLKDGIDRDVPSGATLEIAVRRLASQ